MTMWRCPHCGTPQAETARCWVCRRSSTSCGTCRSYRRSVATGLGFCGLDRRRTPLQGDEIRGCWQEVDTAAVTGPGTRTGTTGEPLLPGFVAVDPIVPAAQVPPVVHPVREPGWTLWGDPES